MLSHFVKRNTCLNFASNFSKKYNARVLKTIFNAPTTVRRNNSTETSTSDDGNEASKDEGFFMEESELKKMLEGIIGEQFPRDETQIMRDLKTLHSEDVPVDPRRERQMERQRLRDEEPLEGFYNEEGKEWKPKYRPKIWFFDFQTPWKHHQQRQIFKPEIDMLLSLPANHCENFVLLDVRSQERRRDFKIPTSLNIPLQDLSKGALLLSDEDFMLRYEALKPDEQATIICFSDDPHDAEIACHLLNMDGYPFTLNYRGGVQEWFGDEFRVTFVQGGYESPGAGDVDMEEEVAPAEAEAEAAE